MSINLRVGLALVLGCVSYFAGAQNSQLVHVTGHVGDVTGAAIARAVVLMLNRSPDQSARLRTQTDLHGNFAMSLPEGGYDILVSSAGFQAGVKTVGIERGKGQKLTWKLMALSCKFPGVNCDTVF